MTPSTPVVQSVVQSSATPRLRWPCSTRGSFLGLTDRWCYPHDGGTAIFVTVYAGERLTERGADGRHPQAPTETQDRPEDPEDGPRVQDTRRGAGRLLPMRPRLLRDHPEHDHPLVVHRNGRDHRRGPR